jgi:hypothetical protein
MSRLKPNAPIYLVATPDATNGSSTINLTWMNVEAFDDVIFVERAPAGGATISLATIGGTDQTYSDTTCADGSLYYYRVWGRNDLGGGSYAVSGYSNEAGATTVLPAPTKLAGVVDSTSQITLTWEDNSTNETGFEVWMKKGSAAYALQTTTAVGVETYVKTGLIASTLYTFCVRAKRDTTTDVYSEYSNVISLTTNNIITPVTLTNTAHQDILIIDRVFVTVDNPDITVVVVPTDVVTKKFEIMATNTGTYKIDATHADNGYPITSYIRTKDMDFTDQHPDLAGVTKTLKKFRLIYEDIDADTPVTVYISNDGGANWGTSVATVGTGDGTVKFADFYFLNSEYVTGLNFTFKVESLSTTTSFLWLAFELEFMTRGESFNV